MVPEQITLMVETENESLSVCFLSLSIGSIIVQKILLGLLGSDKGWVNLARLSLGTVEINLFTTLSGPP